MLQKSAGPLGAAPANALRDAQRRISHSLTAAERQWLGLDHVGIRRIRWISGLHDSARCFPIVQCAVRPRQRPRSRRYGRTTRARTRQAESDSDPKPSPLFGKGERTYLSEISGKWISDLKSSYNPVLVNPEHVRNLPPNWGTLYELSRGDRDPVSVPNGTTHYKNHSDISGAKHRYDPFGTSATSEQIDSLIRRTWRAYERGHLSWGEAGAIHDALAAFRDSLANSREVRR